MKKIALLSILMLIFSSVSYAAVDFMGKMMDSWIGYSVDDVIASWGYPDEEKVVADKKILVWKRANYSSSYPQIIEYCNRTLEIDDKNIVKNAVYNGNDCPCFYLISKKLVNPQNDPWKKKKLENKKKRELRKQERIKAKELKEKEIKK